MQTGYQQPIAIDLNATARNGVIVDVGPPLSAASGVYTPPAGENGNISFNYVVRNTCRIQDVGQVIIDVNQDPLAAPFAASISRVDATIVPVSALASDLEPLRIVALEGAPTWVAVVDEQRAVLIDPARRSGRLDLVAVVEDPGGLQARVPMAITLANTAPIAQPDAVPVADSAVTFAPLSNDADPDGDAIALASVPTTLTFANGNTGTIERLADDQLKIDAGTGLGVATFTYTIVDALGLVSNPVTVTVTVNRSPVAPDVDIDVPAGGSIKVAIPATDAEGGPLVLLVLDDLTPLTIGISGLMVTITAPSGSSGTEVTVRYRVADPQGASTIGTLNITVVEPPPTTTTTTVPPTTTTTTTTTTTQPPPVTTG